MTERELYGKKWIEYRLLTPKAATLAFILEHVRALALYNEKIGESPHVAVVMARKIDIENPHLWRNWKSMTRLRIWADERGMKYREFWELGFDAILDLSRHQTFVNAFLNSAVLEYIDSKWAERFGGYFRYAESDFFQPAAYEGHPLQDEYYEAVLSTHVKGRRNCNPERILQMVEDGQLSMDFLKNRKAKEKQPNNRDG